MIIYACKDLIFSTKIRSTAEAVGVPNRAAGSAAAVSDRLNRVEDGKLNEPVTGVLVDMDLGDAAIAIIEATKAHTPQVHVIAFGSHVAADVLEAARRAGADEVLPRSAFTARLPDILRGYGGAEL